MGQYVVLKFDDLASRWWREWKILADIVKAENIKAGLGIWCASLLDGDAAYDSWIAEIARDPRFELWSHGYTGHGPNGEPGMEHQGTPYDFQKASFDRARDAMLTKCDLVLRTYSEHWHGGDATTLRVFNEDPYLRVWMCWAWSHREERIRDIIPDRRILDRNAVEIECADPKNWAPGYVNSSEFERSYTGHEHDPYVILQGHPWSWTDTSAKPDRTGAVLDRWAEFRKVIAFLKARDVEFVTPYEYYRIVRGYAKDTAPPAAPTGLTVARAGAGVVALGWQVPTGVASGVDCYKIYRDGKPVGLSTGTTWSDAAVGAAAASYEVVAVSKAELLSAHSAPARIPASA